MSDKEPSRAAFLTHNYENRDRPFESSGNEERSMKSTAKKLASIALAYALAIGIMVAALGGAFYLGQHFQLPFVVWSLAGFTAGGTGLVAVSVALHYFEHAQ